MSTFGNEWGTRSQHRSRLLLVSQPRFRRLCGFAFKPAAARSTQHDKASLCTRGNAHLSEPGGGGGGGGRGGGGGELREGEGRVRVGRLDWIPGASWFGPFRLLSCLSAYVMGLQGGRWSAIDTDCSWVDGSLEVV